MEGEGTEVQQIKELLKKELYSIEPVTKEVSKQVLALAYTPGVGTVCTDIHKNPALGDKFTFRMRSVALVSDGSLLDCEPRNFLPVMDWFVFQIKKMSGVDAYPFVIMKEADMSKIFANLSNSYGAIIYLDGRVNDYKVPKTSLLINHRKIVDLTKSSLTDASYTSHALSYFLGKKSHGQPDYPDYETAINAPQVIIKHEFQKFVIDDKGIDANARRFHQQYQGKIFIKTTHQKVQELKGLFTESNLRALTKEEGVYSKTSKVAVIVTDGTAILGLGNIGPLSGQPVMEGKSLLFRILGDVEVVPFCICPQGSKEIEIIANAVGNFMAVNLQDIKAPECFQIQTGLKAKKLLPVFHDDQHGTAIITLAALINALKLAEKKVEDIRIVINGAGAAGVTIAKLILAYGAKNIIVCDTKGAIYEGRPVGMNPAKNQLAQMTNVQKQAGSLQEVLQDADVFIGVSAGGALKGEWIKNMRKPIIFAMANPVPEVFPEEAKNNGAFIYGSGRSDFQNQINNSLVFPGIFKGIKEHHIKEITMDIKIRVAKAISKCVKGPLTIHNILPSSLDKSISDVISEEMDHKVMGSL